MDRGKLEVLMRLAMLEAAKAAEEGNYPFGAVMTDSNGMVLASAHNTQVVDRDPTAHAEINLIRRLAKEYDEEQFNLFTLFSNAEACSMCFSAAIKTGIRTFIFGAPSEPHMDPYLTVTEVAHHSLSRLDITYGVLQEECVKQIREIRERQGRLGQ
jgi:tRNA(Arg) A34 adenosine deaminase TadA